MRRRHLNGFTLIEVLGAMTILAGAIIGIILAGANGLTASRQIEQSVKSTLLAESEMEYMKGLFAKDTSINNWEQSWPAGDGYLVRGWIWQQPGRGELKEAQIFVGYDTNGDDFLNDDEVRVHLLTLLYEGLGTN